MSVSTSIRIDQKLYEQAKQDAVVEHRSIAGQIEFWRESVERHWITLIRQ